MLGEMQIEMRRLRTGDDWLWDEVLVASRLNPNIPGRIVSWLFRLTNDVSTLRDLQNEWGHLPEITWDSEPPPF